MTRADPLKPSRPSQGNWRERFAVKDETGQRYGDWLVIRRLANAGGNAVWLCRCTACGRASSIQGIRLRNPRSRHPDCVCKSPVLP